MEKMDIDEDSAVDLSVRRRDQDREPEREFVNSVPQDLSRPSSRLLVREEGASIGSSPRLSSRSNQRSLRPRPERSYAESPLPDVVVLSDEEPRLNGYVNGVCDSDSEGEMPPLPPIKELSPAELAEREKAIQRLREELRNEEMKLVLLKKLRQSQQMKENIAVVPPQTQNQAPTTVSKPQSSGKLPPPPQPQQPPPPLVRGGSQSKQPSPSLIPPLLRGPPPSRTSQMLHAPPPLSMAHQQPSRNMHPGASGIPPNILMAQQSLLRGILGGRTPVTTPPNVVMGFPIGGGANVTPDQQQRPKEAHHSPNTPNVSQQVSQQERLRTPEDNQTPAQRQAAAKLALRKQLEKTLLQIPPPKPPPPEMHFIPNPSNPEFIYLLGLEHVVDFIMKEQRQVIQTEAFTCSQCRTDFTPVWKWEKGGKGREPKVICEHCVTTNVKKALKAEHTNRLKTAFVKALQQEQEIEQRLAQVSTSGSPQPDIVASSSASSSQTPTPKPATPTPVPTPQPSRPPSQPQQSREHIPPQPPPSREHTLPPPPSLPKLDATKFAAHPATALQAAHQQLFRLPQHTPLPAHMLPLSPLLYPYQLAAVAQAAAAGSKSPVAAAAANLVELQRQAADLQRQYLLDMIPPGPRSLPQGSLNWKT